MSLTSQLYLCDISFFQKISYNHNIRGWLKSINDVGIQNPASDPTDLFAFEIMYNQVEHEFGGEVKPLFNGNISQTFWKTDSDNVSRSYGYKYDDLNRLLKGIYQRDREVTHSYDETLAYDKNGNITDLSRHGYLDVPVYGMIYPIDNLVYGYAAYSNKLLSVYDQSQSIDGFKDGNPQGDDYDYDANGNMTVDRNKNIESITYNHLNLPTEIDFGDSGIIYYIYNALGVKVGKTFTTNYMQQGTVVSKTDYLGGFQYLTPPSGAGGPQFFPTAEGYVKVTDGGKFNYVYNYTDHLGNIRVSYTLNPADGQLKILEENHYYPFGLKHSNYNVDKADFDKDETGFFVILKSVERNKNQYKYNGKELQDDFGLNLYDYGARNYDPAIGRWMNMDAQSEKWHTYSPYTYVLNNPLTYIDPDGNDIIVAFTGGPTGGGKTVNANSKEASTAGRVVQEAQKFAEDNGIEFSGRVITPGVTSASSIKNAMGFIKENYTKGEKVVIYGYSYGGDFAVELAEALEAEGISVDLLVTVDAADGTGSNITVDNEIPENVENAVNFFQDTPSGLPSGAQHGTNSSKEGGKKSKESSGNSNGSPASHGGKKHAANSKKTDVRNYRVKDKNVNHGNIDEKTESLVNTLIQSIMQN